MICYLFLHNNALLILWIPFYLSWDTSYKTVISCWEICDVYKEVYTRYVGIYTRKIKQRPADNKENANCTSLFTLELKLVLLELNLDWLTFRESTLRIPNVLILTYYEIWISIK